MIFLSDELHREGSKYHTGFLERQISFVTSLEEISDISRKYGFIHSIPLISSGNQENFGRLYDSLMRVVCSIVENYHESPELQEAIPLPDDIKSYLRGLGNYDIGCLRPDFLIDEDGKVKINEINARYSLNGCMISYFVNGVLNGGSLGDFESIPSIEGIVKAYDTRVGNHVALLKISEPDWDCDLYRKYLKTCGRELKKVDPLKVDDYTAFDSAILELKQREIYEAIRKNRTAFLKDTPHMNDLRTILIAHDKRLLSVLWNDELVNQFACSEDLEILMPHLIETYDVGQGKILDRLNVKRNREQWVLKHALKGKSQQVYIGHRVSDKDWGDACDKAAFDNFVLQRKVKQKPFHIYIPYLGSVTTTLEGMLLGFDGKFLSEGIYRGKFNDPTRLCEGFLFVPPANRSW